MTSRPARLRPALPQHWVQAVDERTADSGTPTSARSIPEASTATGTQLRHSLSGRDLEQGSDHHRSEASVPEERSLPSAHPEHAVERLPQLWHALDDAPRYAPQPTGDTAAVEQPAAVETGAAPRDTNVSKGPVNTAGQSESRDAVKVQQEAAQNSQGWQHAGLGGSVAPATPQATNANPPQPVPEAMLQSQLTGQDVLPKDQSAGTAHATQLLGQGYTTAQPETSVVQATPAAADEIAGVSSSTSSAAAAAARSQPQSAAVLSLEAMIPSPFELSSSPDSERFSACANPAATSTPAQSAFQRAAYSDSTFGSQPQTGVQYMPAEAAAQGNNNKGAVSGSRPPLRASAPPPAGDNSSGSGYTSSQSIQVLRLNSPEVQRQIEQTAAEVQEAVTERGGRHNLSGGGTQEGEALARATGTLKALVAGHVEEAESLSRGLPSHSGEPSIPTQLWFESMTTPAAAEGCKICTSALARLAAEFNLMLHLEQSSMVFNSANVCLLGGGGRGGDTHQPLPVGTIWEPAQQGSSIIFTQLVCVCVLAKGFW